MFVILLFTFLLSNYNCNGKVCDDCVPVLDCLPAKEMLTSLITDSVRQHFRNNMCGVEDETAAQSNHKICCSAFGAPVPVDSIESHENLKLLPTNCGITTPYRMLGGHYAMLYEFPWIALISLRTRFGLEFQCTGTIINSRYVMTAASCIHNKNIAGVRVGDYDIRYQSDCQGQDSTFTCESHIQDIVADTIDKPEVEATNANDIALIRLKSPIDFKYKNVAPICLPIAFNIRNTSITEGTSAPETAGWGLQKGNPETSVLHKATINIKPDTECNTGVGLENKLGNKEICAGSTNPCIADAGGPLMKEIPFKGVLKYVQYGVVSRKSNNPCDNATAIISTDVRQYMQWILDHITE